MSFAKIYRFLTACLSAILLVACVNTSSQIAFNRSEAVKARINLALAYLEQNDFAKAKENIDKALIHDETDYLPYSVLAYYHQQIGETENAEQTYRKAIALSQTQSNDQSPRPDVLNNYGTFLCKHGQFAQAYNEFERALASKQPYYHQADTLENMVLCAEIAKDSPKQQQAFEQLRKLNTEKASMLRDKLSWL